MSVEATFPTSPSDEPDATPRTFVATKFPSENLSYHYVSSFLPHPVFLPPAVRFEPIVRHFCRCVSDILFLSEKHRYEANQRLTGCVNNYADSLPNGVRVYDPGVDVNIVFGENLLEPVFGVELRDPDLDEEENEMLGRFCSNSHVVLTVQIFEIPDRQQFREFREFRIRWWLFQLRGSNSGMLICQANVTVDGGERNQRMLSRDDIHLLSEAVTRDWYVHMKSKDVGILYHNEGVRAILLLDQSQAIAAAELDGFPDDDDFPQALDSFLHHSPTSAFVWHDFLVQIDEDEMYQDFLPGIPIERQTGVSRSFRLSMPFSVLHLPSRRFIPLSETETPSDLCVPAPSFCCVLEMSGRRAVSSVYSGASGASGQISVWTEVDTLNEPVVGRYLRSCGCDPDTDSITVPQPMTREDDRRAAVDAADLIMALRNAQKGLVWSPKLDRRFSAHFRLFVRLLLLCRSRSLEKKTSEDSEFGSVFGKIPLDVLLYCVFPYFDEMEVWTHMHPKMSMLSWLEKNDICRDEDGKLVAIGDDEIRVPDRKIVMFSNHERVCQKIESNVDVEEELFGTIRFLQGFLRGQLEDENAEEEALSICCSWLRIVPKLDSVARTHSSFLSSLTNRLAVMIVRLFLSKSFVAVNDWPLSQIMVLLELWGSSWYPLVEQLCPEEIPFLFSKMAAFRDVFHVFLPRPDVCIGMIAGIRACGNPSILGLLCEELLESPPDRHVIVFVEQLVTDLMSEEILWEDDVVSKTVIRMCAHHGRVCRAALVALSGHPKFLDLLAGREIVDLSKNAARLHRELIVNYLTDPDWFEAVVSEETSGSHMLRLVMSLMNVRLLRRLWKFPEDGVLVVLEKLVWFLRNRLSHLPEVALDDVVCMDGFICDCLTEKMYGSSEIHLACLRILQALFDSTGADLHKSTMELLSRTLARSPLFPQSDYLRCLLSFSELLNSVELQKDLEDRIWYEELCGMIENGVGLSKISVAALRFIPIAKDARQLTQCLLSVRHSVEIGAVKLTQEDCRKFFGCFDRNAFFVPATTDGPSGFQCRWIENEWTELTIWLLAHDKPDWIPPEECLRFVSRGLENPRTQSGEPTKYWRVVLDMLKNDAVSKSLLYDGSVSFPLSDMLDRGTLLGSVLLIRDVARYCRHFWLSFESVKAVVTLAQSAKISEVDVALAEAKDALHSHDSFQVFLLETVFHTQCFFFDLESAVWWLAFLRPSNLETLTSDPSPFFEALALVDEISGSRMLDQAQEMFASANLLTQYVGRLTSRRIIPVRRSRRTRKRNRQSGTPRRLKTKLAQEKFPEVNWTEGSVPPMSFPPVPSSDWKPWEEGSSSPEFNFDGTGVFVFESESESASDVLVKSSDGIVAEQDIAESMPWCMSVLGETSDKESRLS